MTTTRTTTRRGLPSSSWRQTVARVADERRTWTGVSGLTLTGQEVADHLDAARQRLAEKGWSPREGRRVFGALYETSRGGPEDRDTRTAAAQLLDLILAARAGVQDADHQAWESRVERTWPEVSDLLSDAVQFAREHGPQGGAR